MSNVRIRRARQEDEGAMRWITHDVWEGTDYIPLVWRRWLRDPNGVLMVVEVDGRAVGLQHVELQPDGTAWLEGIRVATEMRGAGIGRALVEDGLRWARESGSKLARMAIASQNDASNRLAMRAGFEIAARFQRFRATEGSSDGRDVRLALPSDEERLWREIAQHGIRLYGQGWTAYSLTRERLRLLLATHAVATTPDHGAVAIATATPERPVLRPGLLYGNFAGMCAIASWLRQRSTRVGRAEVAAVLPTDDVVAEALIEAGYEGPLEPDVLIRERRV